MPKVLCMMGLVIAALVLIVFLLDLLGPRVDRAPAKS